MMNRNLKELYWPKMLGSISKIEQSDSPYLLFTIQNAHFLLDTQESIIEILSYLNRNFDLQHVFVEGAQGELPDFSRVRSTLTPDEGKLLRTLLRDKTISGPEYFAITSGLPFTLYGVENVEQYIKNVEAQSQAYNGYQYIGAIFEQLEEYVARLKAGTFSQELLNFDRATQERQASKIGISDFLDKWVRKYFEVDPDRYPNLEIYRKATEMEKALVHPRIRSESSHLLQEIMTILDRPAVPFQLFDRVVLAKYQLERRDSREIKTRPRSTFLNDYRQFVDEILQGLVKISVEIRQEHVPSSEIYSSLIDLSTFCGLDIRQFPNLLLYTHYLHQVNAIKSRELFEEIQFITEQIRETLFSGKEDREAARAWRAVTELHKLCRLEISSDDVDQFISEFGQLFLGELMKKIKHAMPTDQYERWDKAASFLDGILSEGAYGSRLEILTALTEVSGIGARVERTSGVDAEILGQLTESAKAPGLTATLQDLGLSESEIVTILAELIKVVNANTSLEESDSSESKLLAKLSEAPDDNLADLREVLAVDVALEGAYKFYQMAPARGSSLAENTLQYMKDNGVMVAALVSGGFQTSHIVRVLERESVSHMVILPKGIFSDLGKDEYMKNFEGVKTTHPLVQDIINRARLLNENLSSNDQSISGPSTRRNASIPPVLNSTPAPTWSGILAPDSEDTKQYGERLTHASYGVDSLPIHHCQSTYCTNQAGYWRGRIICIGDPAGSIVGWCELCKKYVCSLCSLKLEISESLWKQLRNSEEVRMTCQHYKVSPRILHCKRCGSVLQKRKYAKFFVLNRL